MKKVCLTAMMMVLMVVGAYAQDAFGLKAGFNHATWGGADVSDKVGPRIGFHLGGMAAFAVSENVHIQPELVYSMQGEKDFALGYINIPVMAKIYLTENVNLQVGPQLGFLMSAQAEGEDAKDLIRGTDFGIGFGAGYELETGLNFGIRYNYSTSRVFSDDFEKIFNERFAVSNRVLQFSVGYFFNK